MERPWASLETCRDNLDRYNYYCGELGYYSDGETVLAHGNGEAEIFKSWTVDFNGKRIPYTTIFMSYMDDAHESTDYNTFKEAKKAFYEELKTWKY